MLKKGLVIIAVPFLFQVLFITILWKMQDDSAQARQWAIHTKDVIAQTELVTRFMTEAQNELRGMIVIGQGARSAVFEESA
jgi:CHASE3 domain sensor protein